MTGNEAASYGAQVAMPAAAVPGESINASLKEHQVGAKDWSYQQWMADLHEWAERMNVEFNLDTGISALAIARIRRTTYGRYHIGRNGFGLRGEIVINEIHLQTKPRWQSLGTLLHELLHYWQEIHGRPAQTAATITTASFAPRRQRWACWSTAAASRGMRTAPRLSGGCSGNTVWLYPRSAKRRLPSRRRREQPFPRVARSCCSTSASASLPSRSAPGGATCAPSVSSAERNSSVRRMVVPEEVDHA